MHFHEMATTRSCGFVSTVPAGIYERGGPSGRCLGAKDLPSLSGSHSVCTVAAESVYRPSSSHNLATVPHPTRNEVFISSVKWNLLSVNNQGVASLHYDHVFVVIMGMRSGWRCLTARPRRHLAPVSSVEDVALDPRCRLIGSGDPVRRMLHKFWKLVHHRLLSHSWRRVALLLPNQIRDPD